MQVFLCCLKQEWEVSLFYPCAPPDPHRACTCLHEFVYDVVNETLSDLLMELREVFSKHVHGKTCRA